jgi:Adenylate cyclase, family 3 (some proteins contain HAMP domain)
MAGVSEVVFDLFHRATGGTAGSSRSVPQAQSTWSFQNHAGHESAGTETLTEMAGRQESRERPGRAASGAEIVILLFTDLVGSTELFQRLGDDAAEQVRRVHFRLLREAVNARGGHEVKNLGDA